MLSRQPQSSQFQSGQLHRRNPRPFIFILIGCCLFFSLRYTNRLIEYGQEQLKIEQWQEKIAEAKLEQAELLAHRGYVLTDAYVEEVSRRELLMARPGDTLVVVLPDKPINLDEASKADKRLAGVDVDSATTLTGNPLLVSGDTPTAEKPSGITQTPIQGEPIWQQWAILFSQPSE